MSDTLAPLSAGGCGRQMDDPGQEPWFAVVGHVAVFICPACEMTAMPSVLARTGGGEVLRLPDDSPGTVLALIRGAASDE
jgi:hypothetical protein